MAGRKRSTLGDMVGSSAPKRSRTEGVHDSHEQHMHAVAKATNDTPSDKELIPVVSEQKSAIDKEEKPHEDDATTALASSAASKALHTTELLEQILSYLSGPDLVAATNVNDFFYNCAVNSPDIQQILCLRSGIQPRPQCYVITRELRVGRVKARTIGLTPCAGMSRTDVVQWAIPCRAVRLCPALRTHHGQGLGRNRAKTVVTPDSRAAYCVNGTLSFTVRPTDMGRIGSDMLLSDPPTNEANVYLCYRHTETSYTVSIQYHSKNDFPLTYGALFEAKTAEAAEGTMRIMQSDSVTRQSVSSVPVNDVALDDLMSQYTKAHGGFFLLDLEASLVLLNAIVPTEEEWETMGQVLAEEEEKKNLMDPREYAAWVERLLDDE